MQVLSLFDGIAGARVALDCLGITPKYYASEIDLYAIKISTSNYNDIIQIGDVRLIYGPAFKNFDLLIGGSPCQDLSKAKPNNKGLEGTKSSLFYDFLRILNKSNPRYFVLENVASMRNEYRDQISKELGYEPIMIDSALLTAQSRKRYYWTNIPGITQPEDRHIYLKDIIESGKVDRDKSYAIDHNYFRGGSLKTYYDYHLRQIVFDDKYQSSRRLMVKESPIQIGEADVNGYDILKRVYSIEGKSPTLNSMSGGNREPKIALDNITWRKLTPLECERLQGFPDNYTAYVSNTQRYRALGNSFTVPVIAHILSFMDKNQGN